MRSTEFFSFHFFHSIVDVANKYVEFIDPFVAFRNSFFSFFAMKEIIVVYDLPGVSVDVSEAFL